MTSLRIGRYAGIDVYIHATFWLLLAFIGYVNYAQSGGDGNAALRGVAFILALFGCVLLHEFGHALAARKYNIKTRDITLYPIGGVARLERLPSEPKQELWVALAGPLVNIVIAAILFVILSAQNRLTPMADMDYGRGSFLGRLMLTNLFLVGFNLLPAFPMDGGRVLRALLATRLDYVRATQIAASVGQLMAFAFGLVGLLSGNFMLLFVAFFVYAGAGQEATAVQMKQALGGIPVSRAMQTNFQVLRDFEPLSRAVDEILRGSQQDFPVTDEENRVVGVLTRDALLLALSQNGANALIGGAMSRDFTPVEASEMLEPGFARLQENHVRTLPVLHNGQLVGLLTPENLQEFLLIQKALGTRDNNPTSGQTFPTAPRTA